VAFVDAGDVVVAEFFERAIFILRCYPNVAFVYSWVRYCGPSATIWPTWNAELPYLLGHCALTPFAVVRRSAYLRWARNASPCEYRFADCQEWIALLATEGTGVSLPHPLVHCRLHPDSTSHGSAWNQRLYLYDVLTQRCAEAYREWGVELFNLQNANGPGHLWNPPAVVDANRVSWRDRELGGRLVHRARKMWLVRQALRYPGLKKAIKKTLGM
jgi:glycogen(starch) synthase